MKPEKEIREEIVKKIIRYEGTIVKKAVAKPYTPGDLAIPSSPIPEEEVEKLKEKLYRQPRGLLRTSAITVGKDSDNLSLFKLQAYDDSIKPTKDLMSKNTSITALYLMALWQSNEKNENGYYVIKNLSDTARPLNIQPQELKNYIANLGAWYYPSIKREVKDGKKILTITNDFLFSVKWNFLLKESEYNKEWGDDEKVGTRISYYLKNVPVESIEIKPNQYYIEELEDKHLANIFVSDDFLAFSLDLSNMAYKIFTLSGGNEPSTKVTFKTLVSKRYLNLEYLVYGVKNSRGKRIRAGKGKPYILEKIKDGFIELEDKGHIEYWSYDDKKDMFEWKYTDKIFKHRQLYTYGDKEKSRKNNKKQKTIKKS